MARGGKRTAAQLWSKDIYPDIASINLGDTNLGIDQVREVVMELPKFVEGNNAIIPCIWKIGVAILGNPVTGATYIVKWRVGRDSANTTTTGTTINNMQDDDTIILDELQDTNAEVEHAWFEYTFPKGLLVPNGKLYCFFDMQNGAAGSSLSYESGVQVQYTLVKVPINEFIAEALS